MLGEDTDSTVLAYKLLPPRPGEVAEQMKAAAADTPAGALDEIWGRCFRRCVDAYGSGVVVLSFSDIAIILGWLLNLEQEEEDE